MADFYRVDIRFTTGTRQVFLVEQQGVFACFNGTGGVDRGLIWGFIRFSTGFDMFSIGLIQRFPLSSLKRISA